jgi:hypothetical protein
VSNTRKSDVPLTGIALGAVALALVVVFAVLLPKAVGDTADSSPINLPKTLPGGYVSAALPAAWKGNSSVSGQEAQIVKQVQAELDFGDAQLKKSTGGGFGNEIYLKSGGQSIYFVQAFRASGGAVSPGEISDPSKLQQGSSVDQLTTVGKATCIVTGTVGTGGQVQPAQTKCQESEGDLTVQVTAPSVAASDVAKVADLVLGKIR